MPNPQGTAAGRDLWAWCEAARALGHDLAAWIWKVSPISPTTQVPDWADYRPVQRRGFGGTFVTIDDALRTGFSPDEETVVVADNLPSGGAAVRHPRSVITVHFRALLDSWSVRKLRPWHVRTAFEEFRLSHRARLVLAYSERVGRHLARSVTVVPMTAPLPEAPIPAVEGPVAALLADWWWPPNRAALRELLRVWPEVRALVPGAQLILGGRNLPSNWVGTMAGVEVVGPVADSTEVLARAGVMAFPCPSSSGPKGKTLEALAHGLAVVTTPAGMEGLKLLPGTEAMIVDRLSFGRRLATVLVDPAERLRLGELGRQSILAYHAPEVAVRARMRVFKSTFEPAPSA